MDETIVADLHCHTIASTHAYSTVTEIAEEAARLGLTAVAVTDHGPEMPDAPHLWHFLNLQVLPPRIAGVRVLRGAEINVTDFSGRLDLPEEALNQLDIRIASMHNPAMPRGGIEEITAAWLAVAENPGVDIIGHCGTPAYPFDYERVIPAFGRAGKVVEINEGSFLVRADSLPNCRRIAELCARHGVRVTLDSDAHYHQRMGRVPQCRRLLEEIGFPPELVVSGSRRTFADFCRVTNLQL